MGFEEGSLLSRLPLEAPEIPFLELLRKHGVGDATNSLLNADSSAPYVPMTDLERTGCFEPPDDTDSQEVPTESLVRPSISFHGLVAKAILSCPSRKMTLDQICEYVSANFPFYQRTEADWRPFIKHTLALTGLFREVKLGKERLWTIRRLRSDLKRKLLDE